MSDKYNSYESPFCTRYASKEMQYIFSANKKFTTWRRLWTALARGEMKLGLPVTQEQVDELEANIENINYEVAEQREREVRHDVMAHVYAYGKQCPKAEGIIHLGATSCYVGDNTDIIVMRDALKLVKKKLLNVISNLSDFAKEYKSLACLGYTHLQPAQPTTVGKRATLWINELIMDLKEVDYRIENLALLGQKGTTGTQASFVELFDGDSAKIKQLEQMIAEEMGFTACVPVSGQTYSRKVDFGVLSALSGIAQSCSKFSNDLRILQSLEEMAEPFGDKQIGSSAMPYKRNPMRSERITALSRYVMIDVLNPAFTAGTQWFERTLDDSANKRIAVAEAFLATDAILNIMMNVTKGMEVYPEVIRRRFMEKLPFMATENIMMRAVKNSGKDRQELHEEIRKYSHIAARRVKEGGDNNLVDLIANDPIFCVTKEEILSVLVPDLYVGRAPEQVDEFIAEWVQPVLDANKSELGETAELSV